MLFLPGNLCVKSSEELQDEILALKSPDDKTPKTPESFESSQSVVSAVVRPTHGKYRYKYHVSHRKQVQISGCDRPYRVCLSMVILNCFEPTMILYSSKQSKVTCV